MDSKKNCRDVSCRVVKVIETLESRLLRSTTVQSYDGTGNNLTNPTWGSAGTTLIRLAAAGYGDGLSTPAGAARASARAISNAVAD